MPVVRAHPRKGTRGVKIHFRRSRHTKNEVLMDNFTSNLGPDDGRNEERVAEFESNLGPDRLLTAKEEKGLRMGYLYFSEDF